MRQEGWESRLMAEIEAAKNQPFDWGRHDCLTWACNVLHAITGKDYLGHVRGRYKTRAGAYRLIKKYGTTLAECIDQHLSRIPVAFARRGDLVMRENAVGVCVGVQSLFVTERDGLQGLSTLTCETAWRVD